LYAKLKETNLNRISFYFLMEEEYSGYEEGYQDDSTIRVRDLEEKQRILKDRVLLIGQNLIEMREKHQHTTIEIKKDLEMIKQNMERMVSFLETASSEFSKFARKEDLILLTKQAKMFQPLNFVLKSDFRKIKK
jgi:hypothetical protein